MAKMGRPTKYRKEMCETMLNLFNGGATVAKYFDVDYLFGAFTAETLPSRYLRTYAQIEKMWGKTPLERQ